MFRTFVVLAGALVALLVPSLAFAQEESVAAHVEEADTAAKTGHVLQALRHLESVLDRAIASDDTELAELTRKRVEQLLKKLGVVTVHAPTEDSALVVQIDDTLVDSFDEPISVDPGRHHVHAEGTAGKFDEDLDIVEGARATVTVRLAPEAKFLLPGQLACLRDAVNQQDAMSCIGRPQKPFVARVGVEFNFYQDTYAVRVLNPSVRASVASPTAGWNVGASYLVDVVSAASPDMISTASPHGSDTRHVVTVNGGYKPGAFGVEAGAMFSTESDYISRAANVAVSHDLFDKRFTPRLGYALTYDTIGRGGTPYDVFHHDLTAHEVTAGGTIVVGPTTVLTVGASVGIERGDQSKPYRLIPMFAPGVDVRAGASVDEVNAKRLAIRPYEQLPLSRDRYSLDARLNQRLGASTLRLEERLYSDSWDIHATSTDLRWLVDVGPRLTIGPHARFHIQTGASFHERVYHATTDSLSVPSFRTTDRELSPLVSVTGGAQAWWRVRDGWTIYASGDAIHSHYFDSVFTTHRWAGYGTIGVETEFE